MKTRSAKLSELKSDPQNANKGTQRGNYLLEESIQRCGIGRGIVVDSEGGIIAGNKTYEKAGELGFEDVIIVPTDGKQLVVTQRTDLAPDDPRRHELAIADNRASEVGLEWDGDILKDLGDLPEVDLGWMFTAEETAELFDQVPDVEFKEFDEEVENEVQYCTCPACGHKFPK